MRILPNPPPASPPSSRPASVLSPALTRTSACRQGEGPVDDFTRQVARRALEDGGPRGKGIPIRLN